MRQLIRCGFVVIAFFVVLAVGMAGELFPQGSPPANSIDVVNVAAEPADTKLAATTLQGQVNSGELSEVFLIIGHWDLFWRTQLAEQGHVAQSAEITLDKYFEKYADRYDTVIVYDPAVPASVNVATMMASLQRAIVIAPGDIERFGKGKKVEDLAGRWTTNAEAYYWALGELWPKMNHGLLACYQPTDIGHHMRDYFIRHKVFHFWVTGEAAADQKVSHYQKEMIMLERILETAPVNIPVIGWWGSVVDLGANEYGGVGEAGEYGKFTVACDFASNLSLLGGVPVDLDAAVCAYRQRLDRPAVPLQDDRIYIAFNIVEAGDSPSYMQNRQFEVWADPRRGEVPISWAMGVGAMELEPPVVEYYLSQATANDYIYVAMSGVGYCHPYRFMNVKTPDPEAAWQGYLELTGKYMRKLGCNEIGIYTGPWSVYDREKRDPVTLRFVRAIPDLKTIVSGMGRDEGLNSDNANFVLGDRKMLVSNILTRWPVNYNDLDEKAAVDWLVEDIRAQVGERRPAFMNVMALSWKYTPSMIADVYKQLGEEFVAVTVPELTALYNQASKE